MGKSGIAEALGRRIASSQPGPDPIDNAYDAMFGLKRDNGADKVAELDLDLIKPHPLDPFKPYSDAKLKELAESIAKIGLLDPINVRPCGGGYEILTGKNRANAVRLNGEKKIKAVVRDVDDDTAIMIITDSNLKHREKLLPSEKAFSYKLQLEAIKRQGKRDVSADYITSTQIGWKSESANFVAGLNDVSKNEIRRFIRLTHLIEDLLDLVDMEKIPLIASVNLSYIDVKAQNEVYRYFFVLGNGKRLDLKSSEIIKKAAGDGKSITAESLDKLLKESGRSVKSKSFLIRRSSLKEFAGKIPNDKELEKLFMEFLKEKFSK